MRKILFLAVLAVILAALFAAVIPVMADDDNTAKAGQRVLAQKEKILQEKKANIGAFVVEMATDRVITGDEMVALNKTVDDFTKPKPRPIIIWSSTNLRQARPECKSGADDQVLL